MSTLRLRRVVSPNVVEKNRGISMNPSNHLSRRAFLKASLATAGGVAVSNWGGLTSSQGNQLLQGLGDESPNAILDIARDELARIGGIGTQHPGQNLVAVSAHLRLRQQLDEELRRAKLAIVIQSIDFQNRLIRAQELVTWVRRDDLVRMRGLIRVTVAKK